MTSISWLTAWRIARRDLRQHFRGLRLLVVCLFLGVGALAAIGSLTTAIRSQLDAQGQTLLGGDLEVTVWQRDLDAKESAFIERHGTLSRGYRLQAMASTSTAASPMELKAVDRQWPLYGRLKLSDGRRVGAPAAGRAWLAAGAAERLGVHIGDTVRIGTQQVAVSGIIADEPDRLSEGFQLGQTIIVPRAFPAAAGLIAPGSMYQSRTRMRLSSGAQPAAVEAALKKRFPDAGLQVRTRDRASPGADRFVSRMGDFLTLVGLAALSIAGIGIGGGVRSYLDACRASIATLKILGASGRDIARIYSLQVAAAALVGAVAGAIAGMMMTPLLASAVGQLLPVRRGLVVDPLALLRAVAFGLLLSLVFAAPPILSAREFPPMALMRARVTPLARRWRASAFPVVGGLAGITALVLVSSEQPRLSAMFLGGVAAVLGALGLLGWGIASLARRIPRPANPIMRATLANIHRPGSATGALVTALGFGLSAFVLLAAVQTALDGNIRRSVPARAPDYFVLDIPQDRLDQFERAARSQAPGVQIVSVPTLRGAILAYGPKGHQTRVADLVQLPPGAWALRSERGLTYSDSLPEGNALTAGAWWPRNYAREPLVSVDGDLAKAIGLHLGDYLTVGLLGVERSARVASFRRIDWETLGFNYVLVFSPNALSDAPHNVAATLKLIPGTPTGGLLRELVRDFPSSSVIEVGPLLTQARDILDQVALAILAASSVTVLAGIAVLLGAIAAARAARLYDVVMLRVLGASTRQLLAMQLAEFGILAAALSIVAVALGGTSAWLIVTRAFGFDWLPDWPRVLLTLCVGIVLVLAFALSASLPLLRTRPAEALRKL